MNERSFPKNKGDVTDTDAFEDPAVIFIVADLSEFITTELSVAPELSVKTELGVKFPPVIIISVVSLYEIFTLFKLSKYGFNPIA